MICGHTGQELDFSSTLGNNFGISPAGCIYYHKAKNPSYGSDYFIEEYKSQYGRTYLEDEEPLRTLARRRLAMIKKYSSPHSRPSTSTHSAQPSLLEIGCAAGFFLDEARKAGFNVRGLEISNFAAGHARNSLKLDVRCDSFLNFETTEKFDLVAAFYVVEHFPDQKYVFQKIASLLNPGGSFVFALPSIHGPFFEYSPEEWLRTHPEDHFVDYSPQSLKKIFPLYGLKLKKVLPASYHPERSSGLLSKKWAQGLYSVYADMLSYGDTMEGIAEKSI